MPSKKVNVSLGRIERYLAWPEQIKQLLPGTDDGGSGGGEEEVKMDDDPDVILSLKNATSYWNHVDQRLHQQLSSKKKAATSTEDEEEKSAEVSIGAPSSSLCRALDKVSVEFRKGQLTAIIGVVGSGKSALIQALVKELPVANDGGTIHRRYKTLSYAAQDPWIMDGTVQENIVLGHKMEKDWYNKVSDGEPG